MVVPIAGVKDWYARDKKESVIPLDNAPKTISLACSTTGIITMAYYYVPTVLNPEPPDVLKMNLIQRRTEDVFYQQYFFKTLENTILISGRDANGKNLRFDQSAIDEGRVFVRVNGISMVLGNAFTADVNAILSTVGTTSTITFKNVIFSNSSVDVSVYLQKSTIERTLTFTPNYVSSVNSTLGSWNNIKSVKEYGADGNLKPNHWWIYTCSTQGVIITSSRLQMIGLYLDDSANTALINDALNNFADVRFLLASAPYGNVDRYLNYFVSGDVLRNEFALSSLSETPYQLYADLTAVTEMFPPFQLIADSFIAPDIITTTNSIPSDTTATRLSGKKIIGPV